MEIFFNVMIFLSGAIAGWFLKIAYGKIMDFIAKNPNA